VAMPVDGGANGRAREAGPLTHLAWRPAQVPVLAAAAGAAQATQLPGRVLARSYLGDAVQYLVQTALGPVKGSAGPETLWQEGDAVAVRLDPAVAAPIRGRAA